MSYQNSGEFREFVTQTDVDEKRRKRQEEWEKVRKPDQPLDAPEEEYDHRSLYDRLKEQKDKKQAEYEEAYKLKNMIKGLDDDEVHFLDLVEKTREKMETRRLEEEGREIAEYRKAVASLAEAAEGQRLQELINATTQPSTSSTSQPTQRKSQSALLAGAVKRKSVDKNELGAAHKRPRPDGSTSSVEELSTEECKDFSGTCEVNSIGGENPADTANSVESLTCIGVLPGLGVYTDSSDSEESSASDEVELMTGYDLLGRSRYHSHAQEASSNSGKV